MREIKFRSVTICKVPQSYALRISARPHRYVATTPLRSATTRCNFFRTCSETAAGDESSSVFQTSTVKKKTLFIEIFTSLFYSTEIFL